MRFPEEYGEVANTGVFPAVCPHCGAGLTALPGIEVLRVASVLTTAVMADGHLYPRGSEDVGPFARFACGTCSGRIMAGE